MFGGFASFVYRNRRRVLLVALLGIAVAGAFGLGRREATEPLRRHRPFDPVGPGDESLPGRDRTPDRPRRRRARDHRRRPQRGGRAARASRSRRSCARVATSRRVSSYYDTHDPAMVSRDGRSTYVVAYFQPKSDLQNPGRRHSAWRIKFAGQRDVELGGGAIADAQVNTQVGNDLARAELFAFPIIFLLSLLFFRSLVASLLPPLPRRPRDPRAPSSRCGSSRASPTCRCSRSTSSPASGSGSRSTTACSWSPATARRQPAAASASTRFAGRSQPPDGRSSSAR